MSTVFWNGRLVPLDQVRVSVLDRGFLYGDGVFETVRVVGGRPFLWTQHMRRWRAGAEFLGIEPPMTEEALRTAVGQLVRANGIQDGVLRLTLSRGPGPRGYSPRGAGPPTLVMTLDPLPGQTGPTVQWRVRTSKLRIPGPDPLCRFKTCNRLLQILARAEAEATGGNEAMLVACDGHVIEGSSSNVFWVRSGTLYSPGPEQGALPGITRAWVMAWARAWNWPVVEASAPVEEVWEAEGVFLTLSTWGIVEVTHWDDRPLQSWPGLTALRRAYQEALQAAAHAG